MGSLVGSISCHGYRREKQHSGLLVSCINLALYAIDNCNPLSLLASAPPSTPLFAPPTPQNKPSSIGTTCSAPPLRTGTFLATAKKTLGYIDQPLPFCVHTGVFFPSIFLFASPFILTRHPPCNAADFGGLPVAVDIGAYRVPLDVDLYGAVIFGRHPTSVP